MLAQEFDGLRASVSGPAIDDESYALWDLAVLRREGSKRHQNRARNIALTIFFWLADVQEQELCSISDELLQVVNLNCWDRYWRGWRSGPLRLNRRGWKRKQAGDCDDSCKTD